MQQQVEFILHDKDAFAIEENSKRIAEMIVSIENGIMQVYHTGVTEEYKGKGLGRKLVEAMAAHARQNHLKVDAHCPFVQAEFKKHPEKFAGIVRAD